MQEFGDFANIDVEKLLQGADRQLALLAEYQQGIDACVGHAQDENGLVTVEYGKDGLRELELHPKAMRLSSDELADLIKAALEDAMEDFRRQLFETAGNLFGEEDNPMKFGADPEAAAGRIKEAEAMYDHAFEDVMGRLDGIRRRLQL